MDNVLATRNEYRSQQWAMIIKDCTGSGMSNKEYCRQHGINEKTFYYWLHKIRKQACENAAPQIVAIDAVPETDEKLKIAFKGAELNLPGGVDISAVAAVLLSIQKL